MKKYRIVFPLLLSCILWYSRTDWLDYKPSDKQSEEQQFSSKDGFYASLLTGFTTECPGTRFTGNI